MTQVARCYAAPVGIALALLDSGSWAGQRPGRLWACLVFDRREAAEAEVGPRLWAIA